LPRIFGAAIRTGRRDVVPCSSTARTWGKWISSPEDKRGTRRKIVVAKQEQRPHRHKVKFRSSQQAHALRKKPRRRPSSQFRTGRHVAIGWRTARVPRRGKRNAVVLSAWLHVGRITKKSHQPSPRLTRRVFEDFAAVSIKPDFFATAGRDPLIQTRGRRTFFAKAGSAARLIE